MKKKLVGLGLILSGVLLVAACGNSDKAKKEEEESYSVALVTDLSGVDDRSFNQSAWEGLQEWGKDSNKEKGKGGFNYYEAATDGEYLPSINNAINDGFDLVIGVGFTLQEPIESAADAHKDTDFVLIDSDIQDKDNVVSVVFNDNEAAYLAGIAAAKKTQTNHVGFVGGMEGEVIGRFHAGFVAGVHSIDPDIKIDTQYAGSFGDAAKGKTIASAMYRSGADVIYHAAGDTGNGIFSEARDIMNHSQENPVWVIGVDRDQEAEGEYKEGNVTLTSTIKAVGVVVEEIAKNAEKGDFPGNEVLTYGLKDKGVYLADGQLDDDTLGLIKEAERDIIDGKIEVPTKPKR